MSELSSETQGSSLPVINFDTLLPQPETLKRHGELLPNTVRALVCGPSGCGKTNALLTLITHPNGLRFENIYIYSKSLSQAKYQLLQQILAGVDGVGYFPFQSQDQVIPPEEARANSLMIFDDLAVSEKQNNVRDYFCRGRHQRVDCFYLCQTYTHIPKHLVRDNANVLIIFKQDDMNLRHIFHDHVNPDMSFQQFREICYSCWPNHGFLFIDKDREHGRYRKNFDCFIAIKGDTA